MRLAIGAIMYVALWLVAGPAAAQPSDKALVLARRYAEVIHFEQQMAAIMDSMMPAMMDQAARERGEPLSGELKAVFAQAGVEAVRKATPRMLAVMIPVIADTFTEEELLAAVTYYESPVGQSMLAKAPALTARVAAPLAALGPVMEADFKARLCRELDCDAE